MRRKSALPTARLAQLYQKNGGLGCTNLLCGVARPCLADRSNERLEHVDETHEFAREPRERIIEYQGVSPFLVRRKVAAPRERPFRTRQFQVSWANNPEVDVEIGGKIERELCPSSHLPRYGKFLTRRHFKPNLFDENTLFQPQNLGIHRGSRYREAKSLRYCSIRMRDPLERVYAKHVARPREHGATAVARVDCGVRLNRILRIVRMRSYSRYDSAGYGSLSRHAPARIPNYRYFHPHLGIYGVCQGCRLAAAASNPYNCQVQKLIEAQYISRIAERVVHCNLNLRSPLYDMVVGDDISESVMRFINDPRAVTNIRPYPNYGRPDLLHYFTQRWCRGRQGRWRASRHRYGRRGRFRRHRLSRACGSAGI